MKSFDLNTMSKIKLNEIAHCNLNQPQFTLNKDINYKCIKKDENDNKYWIK